MRFSVLILLIVPLPASAQIDAGPLKAVLIAPDRAEAGSDLYLDASQSTGDIQHYIFTVKPELPGRKQIDSKREARDTTKPRMRAIPGVWTVGLMIISADGEFSVTSQVVTIPGGTPCPEPDHGPPVPPGPPGPVPPNPPPTPPPVPPPVPPPSPVVPMGEFSIGPKVHELAKTVKSPNLAAECKSLADKCDTFAAQIAAGTLTNPQDLLNQMAAAIKTQSAAWQEVTPKIQAGLEAVYVSNKNGRLKINIGISGVSMDDPSGWSTLVREIGTGLRAVK